MSKVTEMVKAEADQTEGETPDEETPAEPSPDEQGEEEEQGEQEATPVEPPAQPNTEAMRKGVETELKRHEKAFAKAVGMPVDALHVCPQCGGAGFTQEDEPEVKEATFAKACPDCNGYGKVRSGSRNDSTVLIDCRTCQGYGYITVESDTPNLANGEATVTIAPPRATDPEVEKLRARGFTVIEPLQVTAT